MRLTPRGVPSRVPERAVELGMRVLALVADDWQESFSPAVVVGVDVPRRSVCVRWDGGVGTQWTPLDLLHASTPRAPTMSTAFAVTSLSSAARARFTSPPPPPHARLREAAAGTPRNGLLPGSRILASRSTAEPRASAVVVGCYPCGDLRIQWDRTGDTARVTSRAVVEVMELAGGSRLPGSDGAAAERAAAVKRAAERDEYAAPLESEHMLDTALQTRAAPSHLLGPADEKPPEPPEPVAPVRDDLGLAIDEIFASSGAEVDGALHASGITALLKQRAKKTPLEGNTMAIFAFKRELQEQCGGDEIDAETFETVLRAAAAEEPTSAHPISQWLDVEVKRITKRRKKAAARAAKFAAENKALCDAIFGKGEGRVEKVADPATHLLDLFERIFRQADTDKSGILSKMQLMKVLKKRAKGTPLDGNSVAMFTLCEQIEAEDIDKQMTHAAFVAGTRKAIVSEQDGPVARWIRKELSSARKSESKVLSKMRRIVAGRKGAPVAGRKGAPQRPRRSSIAAIAGLFGKKTLDADDKDGHVKDLFHEIFNATDVNGDGTLSRMELMNMLKKRAKGTPLGGNPGEMFDLIGRLAEYGNDGEIAASGFVVGMRAELAKDQSGAIGLWIQKELKDLARRAKNKANEPDPPPIAVNNKPPQRSRRASSIAIASLLSDEAKEVLDVEDHDAHVAMLFRDIFSATDVDGDGTLSQMELMNMLKKRAKGTPLGGNPAEMFNLIGRLAEYGNDGEIAVDGFTTGMRAEFVKDQLGPIGLWIQKELGSQVRREKRKSAKSLARVRSGIQMSLESIAESDSPGGGDGPWSASSVALPADPGDVRTEVQSKVPKPKPKAPKSKPKSGAPKKGKPKAPPTSPTKKSRKGTSKKMLPPP